jgi:hypothetical protein
LAQAVEGQGGRGGRTLGDDLPIPPQRDVDQAQRIAQRGSAVQAAVE